MTNIDSLWVQASDARLESLNSSFDSLQVNVGLLRQKTEILTSIVETSNDSIGNQLAAIDILLAVIAVVVGIGGVFLGLYISRKKREIEEMAKMVDEKKKIVDNIAETTKRLDDQIHCNISNLYNKLRKEETNALLDRLVLEPQDITNLIDILVARDLDDDGFLKIRDAYLKLREEATDDDGGALQKYKNIYILLFFQQYSYQSLKEESIRTELVKGFGIATMSAFKRDMIKSTIDICRAISDEDSSFNKEEVLVDYLKALNESRFAKLEDLKNIMEQNIMPKELLRSAVERCKNEGVNPKLFE